MNYSGMRGKSLVSAGVVVLLLAAMFLSVISCGKGSARKSAGLPFGFSSSVSGGEDGSFTHDGTGAGDVG
ncbi:hypothetical protein J7K50_00965, partial [bacterium]|nr:hypothetical protein [bacterium]